MSHDQVKKRPFIVSIAGVSGGGKTTVSKRLSEKLVNTKVIHFDTYDVEGPDDIFDWVSRGASYDEWNLDAIIKDLYVHTSNEWNYIILDYPFAYEHMKMGKWIDLAIFIDTPLDIALARRMLRDFRKSTCASMLKDMENYLTRGRTGYLEMLKTIKPGSDRVINGALSIEKIVAEIEVEIYRRNTF